MYNGLASLVPLAEERNAAGTALSQDADFIAGFISKLKGLRGMPTIYCSKCVLRHAIVGPSLLFAFGEILCWSLLRKQLFAWWGPQVPVIGHRARNPHVLQDVQSLRLLMNLCCNTKVFVRQDTVPLVHHLYLLVQSLLRVMGSMPVYISHKI
jgi:hypothetical protein